MKQSVGYPVNPYKNNTIDCTYQYNRLCCFHYFIIYFLFSMVIKSSFCYNYSSCDEASNWLFKGFHCVSH